MFLPFDTTGGAEATAATLEPAAPAIARRRVLFGLLAASSWAAMLALFAVALAPGGFDALDIALLAAFALYLPWPLLGFWNAAIGFVILRFARDPLALTCPPAQAVCGDEPVLAHTALLICIRNEDPERVFRNAARMMAGLAATPWAGRFTLHLLSDTDRDDIAAREEAVAQRLRQVSAMPVHYRRRTSNAGFKAGNIRDFCEHHANGADFMLVLDADSLMDAGRILRLVRIMEATPRLGILQSLAVGLPAASPLPRLFQFGMRLGMRSYTMGSAWWHADCGPYWGHNALVRIEPFRRHCELPRLPGAGPLSGDILSHDQLEAVLMRRAGYEVRVLPEEGGSFEENPPNLIEHMRRDARWCVGNMQYLKLLALPGLRPASRFQLVLAILMFLASPALLALWVLLLVQALRHGEEAWLSAGRGWLLLALSVLIMFAPKIASALDVLTRRDELARFGGAARFAAGLGAETLFALVVTPISALSHTLTLARLACGRRAGWSAQARDAQGVTLAEAARRFWPHTAAGIAATGALFALQPAAMIYAAPVYGGLLMAVPFAVLTASPRLGRWMQRAGWCAIPEEVAPEGAASEGMAPAPATCAACDPTAA